MQIMPWLKVMMKSWSYFTTNNKRETGIIRNETKSTNLKLLKWYCDESIQCQTNRLHFFVED